MTYADDLHAALRDKGWNQNDLAGRVSEGKTLRQTIKGPNGRRYTYATEPARKSLISGYLLGKHEPSPKIETLIDKALGVTVRREPRRRRGRVTEPTAPACQPPTGREQIKTELFDFLARSGLPYEIRTKILRLAEEGWLDQDLADQLGRPIGYALPDQYDQFAVMKAHQ